MSLPHALLTALVERPCTGAELVRRFDRSIGYFWQATHQQIYRELGRLEEAGWVESMSVPEGPGRQRAYQVLPAGRNELKRWIAQPEGPAAVRDALMVRLRAEATLGPSGLHREVLRQIEAEERKLQTYLEIERRDFAASIESREQKLQHLVLKWGIRKQQMRIEMAREALAILEMPPSR